MLKILKEKNIIHKDQGYALYFYYNGKEYKEVNGKLGDENSELITFDSNFRLASVSKQFIAYSIVDVIKKGLLKYDTTILELYPNLPKYFEDITVRNLLNHTSGIYDYEDMPHNEDDPQVIDRDILDFLAATTTTYFKPGTKYKYSNTAYILLGLIVEDVTNKSIVEYIEENIFKKAMMTESKVNIQGKTLIKDRAYGHIINDEGNLEVQDQYWCSATIGDGGLYSSINDLKKWCKYLVSSKHFQEMKQPNYVGENEYNEYGMGLRNIKCKDKEIIYHCGSTIGTSTLLLFSLDFDICLLFLSNMNNIDTAVMKDNLVKYLEG